jgi:hypothetical protein
MEGEPGNDRKRAGWGPPPDSDLVGVPLVVGLVIAVLFVVAAFVLIGPIVGIVALILVLILALAVSYRVVSDTDVED